MQNDVQQAIQMLKQKGLLKFGQNNEIIAPDSLEEQ